MRTLRILPAKTCPKHSNEEGQVVVMTIVTCPFCGKKGAFLDPEMLKSVKLTCESITCKNPSCKCYDPIAYGYHENMSEELKNYYRIYMKAKKNESDF